MADGDATYKRLLELEALVNELHAADTAQKQVNRSYMERLYILEGQYQKLHDEHRQLLDRIAALEKRTNSTV